MAQRYHSNLETHREPFSAAMVLEGHSRGADLGTDCEHPEVLPLEDDQKRPGFCTEAEELGSNGSWPQSSLSRSLQRAEALLRTTFNPGLKWLLRAPRHNHEGEENEEEGSFVAAHNLVSRSSARLLHLQQGMLGVAPHWQLVSGARGSSPQVCVRGLSQPEGGDGVAMHSSSPSMRGCYRAVTRLLEQRARLLFVHEYGRRVRSARLYVSTLHSLLERAADNENPGDCLCSSAALGSLAQELKLHLNHWSCLSAKARSDAYLRPVVAQWSPLLAQMRDTLALLALQALVLTERYVFAVLSALAQKPGLDSVPREALEEILAGTELYNQLAEEHQAQSAAARWRTAVLQRADCDGGLPLSRSAAAGGCHPAAFPVKELLRVVAAHRGNMAARQLHRWASERSCHDEAHPQEPQLRGGDHQLRGGARRTPEWTWEQLERSYTIHHHPSSPGSSSSSSSSSVHSPSILLAYPSVHLPEPVVENICPVPTRPGAAAAESPAAVGPSQHGSPSSGQCQQPRPARGGLTGLLSASVRGYLKGPVPSQTPASASECNPLLTNAQGPGGAATPAPSACPLAEFCQQDRASVELLLQALVSSGDLLGPPRTPRAPRSETSPIHPPLPPPSIITTDTTLDTSRSGGGGDPVMMSPKPGPDNGVVPKRTVNRITPEPHPSQNHSQSLERSQHPRTEREPWTAPHPPSPSPSGVSEGEPEASPQGEEEERQEDSFSRPRSVQWRDLGRTDACGHLFRQYRAMLWANCGRALRLHFRHPPVGGAAGSVNLWSDRMRFRLLRELCQASKQEVFPKECRAMLDDLFLHLLVDTAHTHWDHGCCRALGSGLKDKCLPRSPHDNNNGVTSGRDGSTAVTSLGRDGCAAVTSSGRDGCTVMTATMEHFLCLFPPLLSCLTSSAHSMETGVCPARSIVHSATVRRASASVQWSSVWVMSKSYQFLSAWSVNKFLLISHGDLKALTACLEKFLQQTEALAMMSGDDAYHHHHHHHQVLLRQQIEALRRAVSELQAFSALALKIFSSDCKKMSEEIFEQTMPSGRHWRALNYNSDVGGSPSEYASAAAESVIGQVVEAVAPFPDDARSLALSVTTTAFMEAWMEHILAHKIRFSIQGALQLKQDFDSIRELLQSDQYRLSSDLHQRLLNLRVFQQVDSAVVCLLQQPQSKPYTPSRGWSALRRCCSFSPSKIMFNSLVRNSTAVSPKHFHTSTGPGTNSSSSSSSMEAAVGGSITNLESMEGEGLTQSVPAATPPGAPYLAPSSALGAAQQEWLDLRIHSSAPRWRLPGLQCLSKSEP